MKSHIGPNGPSKCSAEPGNCPFGSPDNTDENHFHTMKEARSAYEDRLQAAYGSVNSLGAKKAKLTETEERLRENQAKMAAQLVELRAETAQGITFEDANPERAKRRLNESIEFAKSRYNDHLVSKLSKATVLPSGAFRLEDGSRFNTDKLLKETLVLKRVEDQREKALEAMAKVAAEGNLAVGTKYQEKTANGTFSLKVTEGFNESEFDKLTAQQRKACTSEKPSLNIDLARENLPPAKLREIINDTQTLDYIYGKAADVGQSDLNVSTEFEGDTADDKMKSGLKNVAAFYDDVITKHGKTRDMKNYTTEGKNAIKAAVAERSTNVFIPARSQYNGAVVSRRQSINHAKAKELLTEEEMKSITAMSEQPDPQKAQAILTPEKFGKIFKAKKAELRVLEAKDK